MYKTLLTIGGVLVLLVAGFFALNAYIYEEKQADTDAPTPSELTHYFGEEITGRAIAGGMRPIEGFSADILMRAYPGFLASDFEGVLTSEGRYTVQNGKPVFVRSAPQPVSSAESTISNEGYAILLENVSARLRYPTYTESDIDALIELLSMAILEIGEPGVITGVTIVPAQILEDSRCPVDVQCIQAGTVRVKTILKSGLGTAEQVFTLGESVTTEAAIVTLVDVQPSPKTTYQISDAEYRFVFSVEKIQKSGTPTDIGRWQCPADAMICPDGTPVGRTGPKCEFICPQ